MPPIAERTTQNTSAVSSPAKTPENPADDFFLFINQYCTQGGFKRLKGLCQENEELKTKLLQLGNAYDHNIQALTRSENKWQLEHDKCESANSTKDDAEKRLKDERKVAQGLRDKIQKLEQDMAKAITTCKSRETQIIQLTNSESLKSTDLENAQNARKRLEEDLQVKRKQLELKTTELSQVKHNFEVMRSFVAKLESLADKGDTIRNLLLNFFDLALTHMETFLRSDLDDASFTDSSAWKELRTQVSNQLRLPLPASNSPAAKRMRIVAGLVILGEALARYIFRPTHIILSSDVDNILTNVNNQDPLNEMYLRAALLKVLPDKQKNNQESSIKSVIAHVSEVLRVLVPSSRREEFESHLKLVCENICRGWSQVQRLEERVRPSFSVDFLEEWQALPLPKLGPQNSPKPSPSPSAQPQVQQKKKVGNHNQQYITNHPEPMTNEDFTKVVWPAFLATSFEMAQGSADTNSSLTLICQGYILTKAQARSAEQEMTAEEEATRRVRNITRQNGSDPQQTQRRRRNSGIFFSSQGGAGVVGTQ